MNSRRMSTPSAETIAAFEAPARTSMPTRVWLTRTVEQRRHREPGGDDGEAVDGVEQAVDELDRARQDRRHRHVQRRRAPDELHALVEEQDHPEGREHLVEVVAVVEMAEDQHLEQEPEGERARQRQQQGEPEVARSRPRRRPRDRRRPCTGRRARD